MNAPEKLPASAEPHVMKTYGRLPIALSHGRGCWLWDTEGKKYLDGLAGIAVNTLGHGHPKLVPACSYPLTGARCVSRVYTDHGVFDVKGTGVRIRETYGVTADDLRDRLKLR